MPRAPLSRRRKPALPLPDEGEIPQKLYFRIGEVSRLTHTKQYVLRYWETEFPTLKPSKTRSGHRLYRRQDVLHVLEIKRLLYEHGFTIEGARRKLATNSHGGKSKEQRTLFDAHGGDAGLRSIQRELRHLLTILGRKC